jgi:hypothetical protein
MWRSLPTPTYPHAPVMWVIRGYLYDSGWWTLSGRLRDIAADRGMVERWSLRCTS